MTEDEKARLGGVYYDVIVARMEGKQSTVEQLNDAISCLQQALCDESAHGAALVSHYETKVNRMQREIDALKEGQS